LLNSSGIPIKVFTAGYEVIASGVIHLSTPEVRFEIANLVIKYVFKSDSDGTRFGAEESNNELVISLYNFSNPLGEGKLEPMEIGTLGGRQLFTTCFVNTTERDMRQFNYSFLLKEA